MTDTSDRSFRSVNASTTRTRRHLRRLGTSVFLLVTVLSLLSAWPAMGAVYIVTTTDDEADPGGCFLNGLGTVSIDPDCSLREAVIAANAHSNAGNPVPNENDTVRLTAATIYTLTIAGAGEDASLTGDLDVTDSLTIQTPDSDGALGPAVIQAGLTPGSGIDRVIHINPIGDKKLNIFFNRLHFRHGKVTGSGGGIHWDGTSSVPSVNTSALTALAISVYDNEATVSGGGIYFKNIDSSSISIGNQGGTPASQGISRNIVTAGDGGGLYLDNAPFAPAGIGGIPEYRANEASGNGGGAYITNFIYGVPPSRVINLFANWFGNKADRDDDGSGDGGAVYVSASATIFLGATIGGAGLNVNSAINGGGVANFGTITTSSGQAPIINSNTAEIHGGGIYNAGTLSLIGGVLQNNRADSDNNGTGDGGGLYNAAGTSTLNRPVELLITPPLQTMIQGNQAQNGGGIANAGGTTTVSTVQVVQNTAVGNGGAFFQSGGTLSLCELVIRINTAVSGGAIFKSAGTLNTSLSWFNSNSSPTVTSAGTAPNLQNNWWNCDDFPNAVGCATTSGVLPADYTPRLDLKFLPVTTTITPGSQATVTADFTTNSAGATPPACSDPRPAPIVFVNSGVNFNLIPPILGTRSPLNGNMPASGQLATTFTSNGTLGTQTISVNTANGTQNATIIISNAAPQIDLALTKTVDNPTPQLGQNVVFTVTLTNENGAGIVQATNIVVRDLLPTGLTFVSSTQPATYDSVSGNWTIASLNAGASIQLQITATVSATGPFTNVAEVISADQQDVDSQPNDQDPAEDDRATATVTPVFADISVTINPPNGGSVGIGNEVTFTVTVTNDALSTATADLDLQTTLPSGVNFVGSSTSQGTYTSGTGLWDIGTLAPGNAATLTWTVMPTNGTPLVKILTAQIISSDQGDPDSVPNDGMGDDAATAQFNADPQQAALTLTKDVDDATPAIGSNVVFTISVSNTGPHDATNTEVTDLLPSGLTYVSDTPSQGTYNSGTGLWDLGTLDEGVTATLAITASVDSQGTKVNTAAITATDALDNVGSNSDTAQVDPEVADLSVTKTVSPTVSTSGSDVTFTIAVTNALGTPNGGAATNVEIEDVLGAGLSFVSHTVSQGTFTSGTGVWDVGTINPGSSATLTITATLLVSGNATNRAQVSAVDQFDPDSTPNNDDATEDDEARVTVTRIEANLTYCAEEVIDPNLAVTGENACEDVVSRSPLPLATTSVGVGPNAIFFTSPPVKATPYPSEIHVTGLTDPIASITVQIHGFRHPRPDDLDFMLVSPTGERAMIWSDAGGRSPTAGIADAVPATFDIVLDDAAGTPLPDEPALFTGGTYQPFDYDTSTCDIADDFPAPAPAAVNNSVMTTPRPMGVFDGIDGNGTWQLFIVSDETHAAIPGQPSIEGGWCITFVTAPLIDVTKSFTPSVIPSGGTSLLTITLNNLDSSPVTNIDFTDVYPVGLTNTSAPSTTCVGGSVANGTSGPNSTLTLEDATLGAAGGGSDTCTVTVNVTSSTPGNYVNTLPPGSITSSAGANTSPVTATLQVQGAPSVAKAFSPDTIISGNTSTLTITLSNSGSTDITNVSFTDNLPSDVDVAALPTTNCGAGIATGTVGTSTVSLANGTIPASSSCTVTVSVTSSVPGVHTNTIAAGAISSNGGTNAALATDDLTVTPALTVTKAFAPDVIGVNTNSHLTITITNTSSAPATNVLMTDTYPTGLVNASPTGATTTCPGGTATASAGVNSLQLTGSAVLAAGASCTVEVDVTSSTSPAIFGNSVVAGGVTSSLGPNDASNQADLRVLSRPTVTKVYAPSEIGAGGTSTLTITISNPNSFPLTNVGLTDTLDVNVVPTTPGATSVCTTGTLTVATSPNTITLTAASIPGSGQCVLNVPVTSSVFGSYTNTIAAGDVSSMEASSNSAPASATLTVMMPPTVNSAFTPAQIPSGGTSTFSVTLSNPNAFAITGTTFSNAFPAGVLVAGTPATSTTCGGTVTPALDNLSFSFSGGTIPFSGSCIVSINVTSSTPGVHTNTIAVGAVTTTNAGSNTVQSQAQLEVMAAPTVAKAFNPTTFAIGATTDLTITLSNSNGSNITGVTFTDVYPSGMTNAAAAPTSNTCGGTVTASVGGNQLQLANGTIPGSGSCAITIPVTSTTPGAQTNTIAAGDVASANAPANTQPATANVTVVAPPTGTKSFSPQSIIVTGTSTLTIVINNPNPTPMNDVAFTDNYPSGFVNAASPSPTTSCGGSVSATADGTSLGFSGGTIVGNGQCTITVLVRGTSTGNHLNTIAAGGVTTSNFPASTAAISGTLSVGVLNPATVSKSFTPSTIPPNETSTLTITLTNNNAQAISGITFTDTYPSGLTNITPLSASTNCSGGSVSATAGGSSVGLSGASLSAGAQCTVTALVTASALGNYVNTIPVGGITADNASPNASPVTATLAVQLLAGPIVAKSFTPPAVGIGEATLLTITLTNNSNFAITGVDFTDAYPDGLTNTASPNPTSTCGGTATAAPGGTSLALTGGIIPANGSCQVSALVSFAGSGSVENIIPAGAVTSANAQASAAAAAAALQVGAPIPALSPLALLALAALLSGVAVLILRR